MAMRSRCRPGNSDQQRAYFDRGIRVCERWNDFRLFLADMGDRPSPDHSLDRINNDGNYEPGNCRWATATVQANNKQRTRWLTFRGETASLTEMARGYGINRNAVRARLDRGWSTERALTVPAHGRKRKRVESRAELALTRVIEQAVALDDLARDNVAEVVRAELVKGRAA